MRSEGARHAADGTSMWQSDDHPSTVSAIAWSGSEELATACYSQVAFFSAESGEVNQKLQWKGSLVSMVLSPDGDIVACGSQTIRFLLAAFNRPPDDVWLSWEALSPRFR